MKRRHLWALVCGGILMATGCSQETMDRAEQAGGAAGEAIESAADDTARNVDEAAGTVDEAFDVDEGEPEAAETDAAPAAGEEPVTDEPATP